MTRTKSTYLALIAVLLSPMVASAVPISYDEGVDGDLNGASIGALDEGLNTIIGSQSSFDFDLASLSRPSDIEILSITFTVTNFNQLQAVYRLEDIGCCIFLELFASDGIYSPSAAAVTALNGLSTFVIQTFANVASPDGGYNYRWDIQAQSTAVPEPSTLALFGIGLAALGITRRRKKA